MDLTKEWSTEAFRRQGEMVLGLVAGFVDRGHRGEGGVVRVRSVDELARAMDLERLIAEGGAGLSADDGIRMNTVPEIYVIID